MDLEFINHTENDNRKFSYVLTIKEIEKKDWKAMSRHDFEEIIQHPKIDATGIAKLLMDRVAVQYQELSKLKDQLVDKTLLEDKIERKD